MLPDERIIVAGAFAAKVDFALAAERDLHASRGRCVRLRLAKHAAMDLAVDHHRVRIDVVARHLLGDQIALDLHHPGVEVTLEIRERPGPIFAFMR